MTDYFSAQEVADRLMISIRKCSELHQVRKVKIRKSR